MICIKTGFYARLPSGLFLYGDAFAATEIEWPDDKFDYPQIDLLLRVTSMSDERPVRYQLQLDTWHIWFDESRGKGFVDFGIGVVWQPCSTLIANAGQWTWLGYDGVAP